MYSKTNNLSSAVHVAFEKRAGARNIELFLVRFSAKNTSWTAQESEKSLVARFYDTVHSRSGCLFDSCLPAVLLLCRLNHDYYLYYSPVHTTKRTLKLLLLQLIVLVVLLVMLFLALVLLVHYLLFFYIYYYTTIILLVLLILP